MDRVLAAQLLHLFDLESRRAADDFEHARLWECARRFKLAARLPAGYVPRQHRFPLDGADVDAGVEAVAAKMRRR